MSTEIEDLLDQTHDAAMLGDLGQLAQLAPRIEAALNGLSQIEPRLAERLRVKAARNTKLLQAASLGVRAAQSRLAEILSGPSLSTYDSRGRKAAIAPVSRLAARRF